MLPEKTSKHIGTATELTCLIPIKPGFIPALDTRTYATRLRIVFKALHALRVASREVRTVKPVLDIVDAARTVHSFSWAIVAERQLLLNVIFDRPWEPYIRVIWKDLGGLLDLFLCNCDGFVPSTGQFEPYAAFVRRHQIETAFFYPSSSLSLDDQRYLVQLEKMQRHQVADFDRQVAGMVVEGPEHLAARVRSEPKHKVESRTQWMAALNVLYGLRNIYPEGTADEQVLHRAARSLLQSSRPADPLPPSPQLQWFDQADGAVASLESRAVQPAAIQGGILTPYRKVTHGCLLLARVENPAKARACIGRFADLVTREQRDEANGDLFVNVAFTFNGLQQLGIGDSQLAKFPKEFREGMEARAGLLGDVRQNHPDNWTLPERNILIDEGDQTTNVTFRGSLAREESAAAATPSPADSARAPVRMATVDVVIIVHKSGQWTAAHDWNQHHPLYNDVTTISRDAYRQGIRVLSVQPLRRFRRERAAGKAGTLSTDHFGFLDGISQPTAVENPTSPDEVQLGELLVGFRNSRMDPPFGDPSYDPATLRDSLIDNSSYLVVRKLKQNVAALRQATQVEKTGVSADELLAKMVGRRLDGSPIVDKEPGPPRNDFDFSHDAAGDRCPFHAHIRRGNPRPPASPLADPAAPVVPRIARRGLAYGPLYSENPEADRGTMFLAYNASIAEQFEIIQRWMSGGNTPTDGNGTSIYSGQPDPLLGLPDPDGTRIYRFVDHAGNVRRVDLGATPFVTLQWGLYLFVPSIAALRLLATPPVADLAANREILALGRRVIATLKSLDDWAAVLEDISANQSGTTAAVCAAIRTDHGGALSTPYGVIVASHALGMRVLSEDSVFSVREYQRRFRHSVGESYLGMDFGDAYEQLSAGPNQALSIVTAAEACQTAYAIATEVLQAGIQASLAAASATAGSLPTPPLQPVLRSVLLPLEPIIDQVLARLAARWFDIPDGSRIKIGGRPADGIVSFEPDTLHCPFHFLAPSRYVFSSPNPRNTVTELGEGHGARLLAAVHQIVEQYRNEERVTGRLGLRGPVSKKLFELIPDDDDLLSRILLGLVFGFMPTVYGNALQILGSWLNDESLWRRQQQLHDATGTILERAATLQNAIDLAMQMRALPPLLHRTVSNDSTLGNTTVKRDDRVVVVVAAMAQEILSQGKSDVMTVFGGDRRAAEHPPHACPGAHIARGVLLGMIAAILDVGTLTPTPALITVRYTLRQ